MHTTNKDKENLKRDKKSNREGNATSITTTNRPPTRAVPHNTVSDADRQNQLRREGNRRSDEKSRHEDRPIERAQRDSDPGNESKNPGQGDTSQPKTKTTTGDN